MYGGFDFGASNQKIQVAKPFLHLDRNAENETIFGTLPSEVAISYTARELY